MVLFIFYLILWVESSLSGRGKFRASLFANAIYIPVKFFVEVCDAGAKARSPFGVLQPKCQTVGSPNNMIKYNPRMVL